MNVQGTRMNKEVTNSVAQRRGRLSKLQPQQTQDVPINYGASHFCDAPDRKDKNR